MCFPRCKAPGCPVLQRSASLEKVPLSLAAMRRPRCDQPAQIKVSLQLSEWVGWGGVGCGWVGVFFFFPLFLLFLFLVLVLSSRLHFERAEPVQHHGLMCTNCKISIVLTATVDCTGPCFHHIKCRIKQEAGFCSSSRLSFPARCDRCDSSSFLPLSTLEASRPARRSWMEAPGSRVDF